MLQIYLKKMTLKQDRIKDNLTLVVEQGYLTVLLRVGLIENKIIQIFYYGRVCDAKFENIRIILNLAI